MASSVLVVDDEPNMVLALEVLMRRAGYDVDTATGGDEALSKVKAAPPDLLILDVGMPERNGYDVCKTLRDDRAFDAVPIILISARDRAVDVEKGLSLGADAFLLKPFATRELVDRVRELINA